jgi:hypothetical protein
MNVSFALASYASFRVSGPVAAVTRLGPRLGLTEGSLRWSETESAFRVEQPVRQYTFNHIKQDNRNLLLGRDPTVDGMKTGYTEAAGYCLVASAQREFPNGKRRLLSVVLGTASREARASESQNLLNWGFTAWDAVRLFEGGKPALRVPVWKGTQREASLGAPGRCSWRATRRGKAECVVEAHDRWSRRWLGPARGHPQDHHRAVRRCDQSAGGAGKPCRRQGCWSGLGLAACGSVAGRRIR